MKKKGMLHFCLRFLKENAWFILTYVILAVLFGSTFYFHNVAFEVYQDALLFTLPLFLGVLCWRGVMAWRRHRQLEQMLLQAWLHVAEDWFAPHSLIEEDYQRLLKKMEGQIRQAAADSERQEQELMEYYGMWSHQIKTPLAALDLLIQVTSQPEKAEMKEEVFKIQQYLDMMLQYLRMQSIQNDFRFEEVSFSELVKPVIKKYASFFIYKDLEVVLENLDQLVITDKKWFGFMLEQVVFNAIKYTKTGSIRIYSPAGQPGKLCIRDTGQGILPEDLPRVFDKGYTGFNGRENQKASGLGLYMCKVIAGQLGAALAVSSEVGAGTVVTLEVKQDEVEGE